MKQMKLSVGVSDFEKIRSDGYYYIDKSGWIKGLLKSGAEVTLLTRPRRFGKTLGMSMLANFFDITKDNRALFEGLEIMKDTELCQHWMNQYPVLFLSFKDVDGTSFENALALLQFTLSQFCDVYAYLEDGEQVTEVQKAIFHRLKMQTASLVDIQSALLVIMRMMWAYYGKKVILLLDEYDVPIAKASSKGYYTEMMEVLKTMLSISLKDNSVLELAVVTGCLKIAKESIFTGLNNFVSDTISMSRFNEYFGFTQKEVDQILLDAGAASHAQQVKAWYDGYHFGEYDIYCPWDVMNFVRDFQFDATVKPASYWKNTSDNAIIRSFIDFAGNSITAKMETLLAGGYIIERIEENLTYDYLHASEDNLWSILYLTGYLTKVRDRDIKMPLPDGMTALLIPNAEIREIFETTVKKWFEDKARTWNKRLLFDAVWCGDSETLTQEMNKLLRQTISYHDYREDFYHAFLAGIFTGAGYMVQSNKEHGEGRSDLVVMDTENGRVAVFEAKYSKMFQQLESDCNKAINQIESRMYAREFEENGDDVFCYGIAFFKKRCCVKIKS